MSTGRTLTKNDLRLLGYNGIDESTDGDGWALWTANVSAGLSTERHRFIYLKSGCTTAQGQAALQFVGGKTYLIHPGRREDRPKWVDATIPKGLDVLALNDLLWDNIKTRFSYYLDKLTTFYRPTRHFIASHPKGEPQEDIGGLIQRWILNPQSAGGQQIRVLLANAGIGKTTVVRHVVSQLACATDRYRKIPVYLDSDQWRHNVADLDSLWRTIDYSLSYVERLEDADSNGHDSHPRIDKAMFDHLLQQGDIVFVLDGFDELCGHRDSPLSPLHVLKELVDGVTRHTSARVLLTSRTEYWISEAGNVFDGKIQSMELAPFSAQVAARYLEKRFPNRTKLQRAKSLLGAIRKENQPQTPGDSETRIQYHPFVVEMVADAVDDDDTDLVLNEHVEGRSEMLGVMRAFCERERKRRNTETSVDGQINAFQGIAVESQRFENKHPANEFSREDFLVMGFEAADADRLDDHPLLSKSRDTGKLKLKYAFMRPLFVARYLIGVAHDVADGKCEWPSLAYDLADTLSTGKDDWLEHAQELWRDDQDIKWLGKALDRLSLDHKSLRSVVFHLAMAVSGRPGKIPIRAERTAHVFSALNIGQEDGNRNLVVIGLAVFGTISNLDLRHIVFRNCFFRNARFTKCTVDASTAFENCRFEGDLEVEPRTAWNEIRFAGNSTHDGADLLLQELTANASTGKDQRIRYVMELGLKKFLRSGHVTASIATANWNNGHLGALAVGSEVKDAFLRVRLITQIETSGVSEGCLTIDLESIEDARKFLESGALSGKVRAAYELLIR